MLEKVTTLVNFTANVMPCTEIISKRRCAPYSVKVPINHLKIADIAKVKQYIPAEFTDFYGEILQWPTANEREIAKDF